MRAFRLFCKGMDVFLLLVFCAISSRAGAGEALAPGEYHVGYRVLSFEYGEAGHPQTLNVALWYPTEAEPAPFSYGGPTRGRVAVEAAPLAGRGPWPWLVVSHGFGGSGHAQVFLAEALAARGWVVAAPDHHDECSANRIVGGRPTGFNARRFIQVAQRIGKSSPADRPKYLYRLEEMKLVLDRLPETEPFRGLLDPQRLAVGGHSLGGFTALGVCGTVPEFKDPRIRAVLLYSPGGGGYLYTEQELAGVQIPSLLFIGERERKQRRGNVEMAALADKLYRNFGTPKYFLELKGGNHFSFNDNLSRTWVSSWLSGGEEQLATLRRTSIAFLERYVNGDAQAGELLLQEDPHFSNRRTNSN